MELIEIVTTNKAYKFIGKHRRDLEKPNWHYYETEDGSLFHFRKEHMISVLSKKNESN